MLTSHPEKTRLLKFGRYAAAARKRLGLSKPETFAFLGFTFISGKSRGGAFLVHRKTRRDRMSAKLKEIKEELQRRMHRPIPEQGLAPPSRHRLLHHFRALLMPMSKASGIAPRADAARKDRTTWDRVLKLALAAPHPSPLA